MKMPICEYSGKYYLKNNAVKLNEVQVGSAFKKGHPYIMD